MMLDQKETKIETNVIKQEVATDYKVVDLKKRLKSI